MQIKWRPIVWPHQRKMFMIKSENGPVNRSVLVFKQYIRRRHFSTKKHVKKCDERRLMFLAKCVCVCACVIISVNVWRRRTDTSCPSGELLMNSSRAPPRPPRGLASVQTHGGQIPGGFSQEVPRLIISLQDQDQYFATIK